MAKQNRSIDPPEGQFCDSTQLQWTQVMVRRTLRVLTLTLALPALVCGPTAYTQNGFKLLSEKEIQARVIGKDITDSFHWVTFVRPDGVLLITDEMGRKLTGTWKIRNKRLCLSNPGSKSPNCNEVWMSGDSIRLRENKQEETFDAVVEKHKAN